MKKATLFVTLLLACFCSASALDAAALVGNWKSKTIKLPSEDRSIKMESVMTLSFAEDGTCTDLSQLKMTINDGSGMFVDLVMDVKQQGTYAVEDDVVTITSDASTIETDYDVRVRGVQDPDMVEAIKKQMDQLALANIAAIKDAAVKDNESKMTDVLILGKNMTCKIEDQVVAFSRKK